MAAYLYPGICKAIIVHGGLPLVCFPCAAFAMPHVSTTQPDDHTCDVDFNWQGIGALAGRLCAPVWQGLLATPTEFVKRRGIQVTASPAVEAEL